MDPQFLFYYLYAFFGLLLVLFFKKISYIAYNLTLIFTDKLQIDQLFIFKIDNKNKNTLLFIMEAFTLTFGLAIVLFSIYHVIYV